MNMIMKSDVGHHLPSLNELISAVSSKNKNALSRNSIELLCNCNRNQFLSRRETGFFTRNIAR